MRSFFLASSCLASLFVLVACGRIAPGGDDVSGSFDRDAGSTSGDAGSSSTTACPDVPLSLDLDATDIALGDDAIYAAGSDFEVRRVGRCDGSSTTLATSDATIRQIAVARDSVYFVAGDDVISGAPPATSRLARVSRHGGSVETLRSSSTESGIRAVATNASDLYWVEDGALWTMPLAGGSAVRLTSVPNVYGKIFAKDGYVFVPEYDRTTFVFDLRRVDPKVPDASLIYPDADGSQSIAFFGGAVFLVSGQRGARYDAPKTGAEPWTAGDGAFAVTATTSSLFVTALNESTGNALFRVDDTGARVLVDQGWAIGPSAMAADDRAIAWTDGPSLHLTPLR